MRRTSDTSIAISNDIKKNLNSQIQSKHNPRLKEYSTNLIQFKKDNLSMVEENYEPSLGISFLDRKESEKNKNKTEVQEGFYIFGQASSRVVASPLDEIAVLKNTNKNYLKNGLNLIRLVSKFIRQLKIHSQTFQYKMINENILQLLGDQASNTKLFTIMIILFQQLKIIDDIKKIKGKSLKIYLNNYIYLRNLYFHQNQRQKLDSNFLQFDTILNKIPIFNPDNIILLGFKIVLFILLIVNITYIPLLLFLNEQDFNKTDIHHLLDTIPIVFCMLDCSLRFITSFYDEGILYKDIFKIAKHYLKNDLIVDILSIIPIFTDSLIIQYLTIFRIIKLKLTLATIEEILCFKQQIQGWWELIKSVFFIVYTCHFFACIWYKIGELGITEEQLIVGNNLQLNFQ